ncbi:hypothetical protein [Coleofasciculus sp.]
MDQENAIAQSLRTRSLPYRNLKCCRVGGLMGWGRECDRYPKRAIA